MSRSTDSSIDADGFHVSTRDRSESDNDNALNVSTGKVSSGRDGRSRHSAFDDELDELENIAMLLTPAQRLRAWLQGDAGLALQGIHLSFATFLLLLFVGAALAVPCILGCVYTNNLWDSYTAVDWAAWLTSSLPLVTLELALGLPPVLEYIHRKLDNLLLKESLALSLSPASPSSSFSLGVSEATIGKWGVVAAASQLVPLCWFMSGIFYKTFNPLSYVFISMTSFGIIEGLRQRREDQHLGVRAQGIGAVELVMWVLLFAPLDYRWFQSFYYYGPPSLGYDWWAIAITVLGIIGWGVFLKMPGFGYRLVPSWWDLVITALICVILAALVIPLGLVSGFLHFGSAQPVTFASIASLWIENVISVAMTEEFLFRVVIMNGINQLYPTRYGWLGNLLSSVFFGLMHLPRESGDLVAQTLYALFAFVCGIGYGAAYTLSGNNIFSPMLTHSLVDAVWSFALQGDSSSR